MTENERMSISGLLDVLNTGTSFSTCHIEYAIQSNVLEDLISCLEELEQYRAIGTVEELRTMKENGAFSGVELAQLAVMQMRLRDYQTIGTIDEFKALKEKQEKGLLLELPCKIGDWVWTWEYPTRIDEEDGSTWTICDIKRATIVSKKFNIFMLDSVGESYFVSKEEAEKALAKKQGK